MERNLFDMAKESMPFNSGLDRLRRSADRILSFVFIRRQALRGLEEASQQEEHNRTLSRHTNILGGRVASKQISHLLKIREPVPAHLWDRISETPPDTTFLEMLGGVDEKELIEKPPSPEAARETRLALARVLGSHILERIATDDRFDITNQKGQVVGNLWESFRSIDPSITYRDMGFSENQVALLDNKAYFPGITGEFETTINLDATDDRASAPKTEFPSRVEVSH